MEKKKLIFSGVLAGDEMMHLNASKGWHPPAAAGQRDRGDGPYKRLVLRGATIIDGTGAPPWGPADIVIENDRIAAIVNVGAPGLPIKPERRPAPGDMEIDCSGKYLTPGLIDAHAHIGTPYHNMSGPMPPADYVYKLWLAHGVTTIREMGMLNGLTWSLQQKELAKSNAIAAPNMQLHAYFPALNERYKTIFTPEDSREWVNAIKERGADGIKFFGAPPSMMKAALDEAKKIGLKSGCHHAQMAVSRMNSLNSAQWGLTSTEHYYGIAEAMYTQQTIQKYPVDYNYSDEYHRFSIAGQNFLQAAEPGSTKWQETLLAFRELDHTFVPTFVAYDATRDLMRARQADWHKDYTWQTIWKFFQPQRGAHGSFWHAWSTSNEIDWKRNYERWMRFVYDYKNLGGRVCIGSDSGFLYQIYGFGIVREMELFQEAGFNPHEIWQSVTLRNAELLGIEEETGTIDIGKKADLIIHSHNPLSDVKLMYGTGTMRLNDETQKVEWHRCIEKTIKSGIVYDVEELLADVRAMVHNSFKGD
ncbi:MAG: amidohydrolase family protein [Pelistega sp.]|nr:amidohydrolase family protein [Pelistega sp.]